MNNVRQNRKERLMQKRWSHIDSHLIGPLDEKEVSLKVNGLTNHLFATRWMRGQQMFHWEFTKILMQMDFFVH